MLDALFYGIGVAVAGSFAIVVGAIMLSIARMAYDDWKNPGERE